MSHLLLQENPGKLRVHIVSSGNWKVDILGGFNLAGSKTRPSWFFKEIKTCSVVMSPTFQEHSKLNI